MSDIRCKLCDNKVYHGYKMINQPDGVGENKAAFWHHCQCGCMFNTHYELPENIYNEEYIKKINDIKAADDRHDYLVRVHAPLIEEKVYGRKMLDVGFGNDKIMKNFERRGWIVDGIDVAPGHDYIKADFEHHDFWSEGQDRYDLIWMGDVLQCFADPVKALYKAYNLLNPFGILFIITPNTDLMRADRIVNWGHWNIRENRMFLNEALVKKVLDRCDESLTGQMRILYTDNNVTSKRFITSNVMHVMAQKMKIEDFVNLDDLKVSHEAIAKS